MAFTEHTEYKEEVLPNQVIQLRTTNVVRKDGVEVGRSHHRTTFAPGESVENAPAEVQAIADVLWTPSVIAAYKAEMAAAELPGVSNDD
tara:strand:- start:196 stop:462 length:267 start_codon:yes stop_codon:yes gene_type:complete